MAFDPIVNFAIGSVLAGLIPATSATSLTLAAGQGLRFPDPGAVGYNCVVWAFGTQPHESSPEIVRVTAKVGDVLTIVRAQEGTTARPIILGDQIMAGLTAKIITDLQAAVPARVTETHLYIATPTAGHWLKIPGANVTSLPP